MAQGKSKIDEGLKKELKHYQSLSGDWKKQNHGKFVLIKNQKAHGIYECYEDALREAVKKWDDEIFLIQEVDVEERIEYNTFALLGTT